MDELKVFNNSEFGRLEVLIIDGKEYFPATDVASKLGYKDPHKSISQHTKKDGWVNHPVIDSLGRKQKKKFIDEGNLYRLIVSSKLPEAEKFESWVFDEVLPTIRKHGAYMTPEAIEQALLNPDTIIQLATNLKEEQNKRKQVEKEIERQKPLVDFAETCMTSNKSLLVREVAKLANKQGVKTGEQRLWQKLRDWKIVMKNKNEPYQEYVDRGYFEVTQGVKQTNKGAITWLTMRVKPKGQAYIINRLKKEQSKEVDAS